ncbi:MAG: hypothetical protein IPH09_15205 [bacterium]|nr:hypothetical protein [bacterium]
MRRSLLLASLALLCAAPASAQILNGDFTTSIASWVPSSTGPSVSHHPSAGNPGGAAYIFYNWTGGNASIEQPFICGSSHGNGNCAISLDYLFYLSGGAAVQVVVELDGQFVYVMNHTAESSLWHTVPLEVPCGPHTIKIHANTITLGGFGGWSVFVDNVTAECTEVVAEETQAWGAIKGIYR